MELRPQGKPASPATGSADALFDALLTNHEWDEARCDAELEQLVTHSDPEQLRAALRPRLHDLGSRAGAPLLRLVEAVATLELLTLLAEALQAQPGLAPERAWMALTLLDDAGLLGNYPELAERWEELNELIEDDSSLDQLAAQIENDPEGAWLALQGFAAVEPEVRTRLIEGLAELVPQPGPNLLEFFRLLSFAHEPATRTAALGALATVRPAPGPLALARPAPRLVRSLVTPPDGAGRALVALSATDGTTRTSAAFLCDVRHGVPKVFGETIAESPRAGEFLEELAEANPTHLLDPPGLAEGLLKGCLLLCGPETTPALRYWLERTLGLQVAPHPFPIPFADWDPSAVAAADTARCAELVLASCPAWIDTSDLTHDIAEEILLREGDSPPDSRRDRGAFRYLFEHRLRGQLELYRRMLLWMASFWQAAGDPERGRSALALATQLSDEQHAVAGHPFIAALTSRSLTTAQERLRAGLDPRGKPAGNHFPR